METRKTIDIKKALQNIGLSNSVINAAWPSWWEKAAENSNSALGELCFSISRKLGIDPTSLLNNSLEPKTLIGTDALFKNLKTSDEREANILSAFGVAIGKILIKSIKDKFQRNETIPNVIELRNIILKEKPFVTLDSLIATCWSIGIPVIHLRIFPLSNKNMNAMTINIEGKYAILLARDASYPAIPSFILAHELGHIAKNHFGSVSAIIDLDDEFKKSTDKQEKEADDFATSLIIGDKKIIINIEPTSSKSLAEYLLALCREIKIEPGILALHIGFLLNKWDVATGALNYIYDEKKDVRAEINNIAFKEINREIINDDELYYLMNVTGYEG